MRILFLLAAVFFIGQSALAAGKVQLFGGQTIVIGDTVVSCGAQSGGACNSYGCSPCGTCTSYGCPKCTSGYTGGTCNSYGCYDSAHGGCNSYGCSNNGVCNAYGCP